MFTQSFHQLLFYKKNEKKTTLSHLSPPLAETPVGGRLLMACRIGALGGRIVDGGEG